MTKNIVFKCSCYLEVLSKACTINHIFLSWFCLLTRTQLLIPTVKINLLLTFCQSSFKTKGGKSLTHCFKHKKFTVFLFQHCFCFRLFIKNRNRECDSKLKTVGDIMSNSNFHAYSVQRRVYVYEICCYFVNYSLMIG